MSDKEKFCKNLIRTVKEFEEKYGDVTNIACDATIKPNQHKLLIKEDFLLPASVRRELAELEMADLIDLMRSDGRT